ncbi:MAG: polysaccharide deacetylase family protein, partial [Lachnospiraceae bacterium]|nr:polysaccharide deacetylase family protein [Lachnospiraceae bacterium]
AVSYEYGPGMEAAQAAAEAEAQAEAQAAAEAAALAEAEAAAQAEAEAAAEAAANLPAGIRPLDPTKPMIALTFDDGPNASVGNRIMNVMNQYGGRCTFFLVGSRVPTYAAEVQRMAAEGFEIANHTQDHKYLNKLDGASIRAQVEACNNTIQAVAGIRPTIMRLPGGNKNSTVMANVNMPIILWNVDTLDWKTRNAQSNINAVLGKVKDGDIILMHELYGATADAVEVLVPALTEQGFQLVTVSELAYYKGVSMNPGQIYSRMP